MTIQLTKVPAFGQQLSYSPTTAKWGNRFAHFLQTGQGYNLGIYPSLFVLSVSCGAIAATAILRHCQSAADFHKVCYGVLLLGTMYGVALIAAHPTKTALMVVIVVFTGLAAGIELIKKYYGTVERESDERIQALVQAIDRHPEWWHEVRMKKYDRSVDLTLLRKEILKSGVTENQLNGLVINELGLTNADLARFKEARWLDHVKLLDLSGNKISAQAVLHCGDKLEILKLTNCNLIDEDLRVLAASGKCRQVKWLALGDNPKLTWEGVMKYIGGDGFAALERLDISGNPQLKGKQMGEWVAKHSTETDHSFKSLKSIELMDMKLTDKDLELMIAHFPWFQNLEGLNLCSNGDTFNTFPLNIADLKKIISDPPGGGGPSGGLRPFKGKAIFVSAVLTDRLKLTPAAKQLFIDGKLTSPHC
jgi:hypothetical protein